LLVKRTSNSEPPGPSPFEAMLGEDNICHSFAIFSNYLLTGSVWIDLISSRGKPAHGTFTIRHLLRVYFVETPPP